MGMWMLMAYLLYLTLLLQGFWTLLPTPPAPHTSSTLMWPTTVFGTTHSTHLPIPATTSRTHPFFLSSLGDSTRSTVSLGAADNLHPQVTTLIFELGARSSGPMVPRVPWGLTSIHRSCMIPFLTRILRWCPMDLQVFSPPHRLLQCWDLVSRPLHLPRM